ncbi:MAG: type IX secretion system membrane protein PorP/SprF [Bacteroidota bacterium]
MKKNVLSICALLIFYTISGQQNIFQNSSLFNYYSLNSAYAGSKNLTYIAFSFQKQWLGIEGSPLSQYISFHNSLYKGKMGYGLLLEHDQIGLHRRVSLQGTWAYHIRSNSGLFSFGLDLVADQYSFNFSELNLFEPDALLDQTQNVNGLSPDAGISFLFQNNKSILGLKASNLMQSPISLKTDGRIYRERIHFDFLIGKAFVLSKDLILKPYLIANYLLTGQYFYDISLNFTLRERVTFGASYRNDNNINLLGHFFVSNKVRIGYSYELGTMRLTSKNPSSLELFIGMNISKDKGDVVSPRFYSL